MREFFYKNWWLYYLILFLLIGWLIYSLLWYPICVNSFSSSNNGDQITTLDSSQNIMCNSQVKSGGKGETITIHELGNRSGIVNIQYDMENIPDKMDVYYNGNLVTTTRTLVSYNGFLSFKYNALNGNPTKCKVVLSAPEDGTSWQYLLNCPE
jgi:hypothetical protein